MLRTLVPNARAIFRLLADFQLTEAEDGGAPRRRPRPHTRPRRGCRRAPPAALPQRSAQACHLHRLPCPACLTWPKRRWAPPHEVRVAVGHARVRAGREAAGAPRVRRAGIAFPHLFRLCRERFLVGNELGLRAHLTEFRDHALLQTRCARRAPGAVAVRSRESVKAFAAARCCSRGALRARPGGPGAAGANAGRGVQSRLPRSPPREQLHRSLGFQRALRSCASARQTPPGNGAHALLRPALARAHSLATCVLSARAACCGRVVCHAALGPHRRASCLCWA